MSLFLTREEVAELTGIVKGKDGKTRYQLQVSWLRTSGIPFIVNSAGRPIITIAAVEGRNSTPQPTTWTPKVLSRVA